MRLLRYEYQGQVGVAVRVAGGIVPTPYDDMIALIEDGERGLERVREVASSENVIKPGSYRVLAPIPRPGKMLFSGVNYRSHLEENPTAVLPTYPHFFAKLPSSVVGPGEPIVLPTSECQVDYEVELAVVIGKKTRGIKEEQVRAHIFGYTIVNDVSGRDVQFRDNQITTGKGFDSFCPMGPEIVLPDEADPAQMHVASYVNGEPKQSSPTSAMLFSVEKLIAFLATSITLYPGDIVTTGTPAGVGCFRRPPSYLKPGDVVVVEVDAIGRLENPVVAGW